MTDDKQRAADMTKRAARDLSDAADLVDNVAQESHLGNLADEAAKTGAVLEDQARSDE